MNGQTLRGVLTIVGLAFVAGHCPLASAKDVLVADRLTNRVYRYSEAGTLLGTVLTDNVNINQPVGMALSPDLTKLYISSAQNSRLIRYDYNYAQGTASNATILAQGLVDGLAFPNAILFEPDGSKLYVSNLDLDPNDREVGVAQFYPDGTSAGPNIKRPIGGGSTFQFSGLAFAPGGELLVGGFLDFPGGTRGVIAKSNAAITSMTDFIGPATSLSGAAGLLVHGDHLYVASMFASSIQRFNVHTGAVDPSFLVPPLAFPQGLALAPDGNGFLAGILGFINGTGRIAHYDFNGDPVGDGVFANNGGGGFSEATVFIVVPDPPPGDFNRDLQVNGADLAQWEENYGTASGTVTTEMGDADGDGDVDGSDFLIWQIHASPPSPLSISVPEPYSVSLVLVAAQTAVALGIFRRRRTSATL